MTDTKSNHKSNERSLKVAGIITIVIGLLVIAVLPPVQNKLLYAGGYIKCGFHSPIQAVDSQWKVTKAEGMTQYDPLPKGQLNKYYLGQDAAKTDYIAGTLITFCSEEEAKSAGYAKLD